MLSEENCPCSGVLRPFFAVSFHLTFVPNKLRVVCFNDGEVERQGVGPRSGPLLSKMDKNLSNGLHNNLPLYYEQKTSCV